MIKKELKLTEEVILKNKILEKCTNKFESITKEDVHGRDLRFFDMVEMSHVLNIIRDVLNEEI
jgi:hypothetical protein